MRKNYLLILILIAIMMFTSIGCNISARTPTPAATVDHEATSVVATVNSVMTQAAQQTLDQASQNHQATQIGPQNTATNPPDTATPTEVPPTQTPFPTLTPLPPTATKTPLPSQTPTQIPCNRVHFISDVTIEDGTDLNGNQSFTKTWRLKNIGSCTWTTDYDLVFHSGDAMGGPSAKALSGSVRPGENVDISVDLIAPNQEGTFKGNWMLRSNDGIVFGLGPTAGVAFWVEIDVVEKMATPNPNDPLDFAESFCAADWSSPKKDVLSCPSSEYDFTNGSVKRTDTPKIEEDYQDDEQTIITVPSDGTGGMIEGKYPAVNVQNGDHFNALIGCMSSSPDCNVMFQLNYSANGGAVQNLDSWTETFDGNRTSVNVDLSSLAGQSVEFILVVQNNGDSKDDRAFWMSPRINR